MGIQSLMSAAQAAGYAMAPSDDFADDDEHLEDVLTARDSSETDAASEAVKAHQASEPLLGNWWRDLLFGWFGGRATA